MNILGIYIIYLFFCLFFLMVLIFSLSWVVLILVLIRSRLPKSSILSWSRLVFVSDSVVLSNTVRRVSALLPHATHVPFHEISQVSTFNIHTLYLALVTRRLPSRNQLTEGLGLPKAMQVKMMLPPSLASTYWGGVSVKEGGAWESGWREGKNIMFICLQNPEYVWMYHSHCLSVLYKLRTT